MQVIQDTTTDFYYMSFINSLKTKVTKKDYIHRIRYFMEFVGAKTYAELVEGKDQKTIENQIKSYLVHLRQNKEISYESAVNYFNPIRKFYYVNSEFNFKWDLIKQYLGNDDYEESATKITQDEPDRPYTRSEIKKMIDSAPDLRAKIIILLMSSSGIRVGSIHLLKIKDLTRWEGNNLYVINVYGRSKKSNYQTFCTPECASVIDTYLNYRQHCGEVLKSDSPLLESNSILLINSK